MEASTAQQLKKFRHHPIRGIRYLFRWTEFHLHPRDDDDKLERDAQQYWNAPGTELLNQYYHWRGVGIFADDNRWLALGRKNLELYQQFCGMMGKQITQKCDLFLSTYVFEVFPTPEYGLKVLRIARKLLSDGGMAIVQVRFSRVSWSSQPKRFAYKRYFGSNAYRVETFWDAAEKCDFSPQAVRLVLHEKLNDNGGAWRITSGEAGRAAGAFRADHSRPETVA